MMCDVIQAPISIHTLRGEGDNYLYRFLLHKNKISIHTLRGEGDDIYALI